MVLILEKRPSEVSIADLRQLIDGRQTEGRRLEFKRDHYGKDNESRKEFAADVSSLANSIGGYLLLGIEEENGVASKVCGIEAQNVDQLIRSVSESIRSSTEPILTEFEVKWVPVDDKTGVLVIYVERSWTSPHRVTVAGGRKFFRRDENGKHEMSVDELRAAFTFAASLEERIRAFRTDRLRLLESDEGPLAVDLNVPYLVFQLVPRLSLLGEIKLGAEILNNSHTWPWPLGASGASNVHSIDGLVSYSGNEEVYGTVRAFSTLFRNGIAEAVAKLHSGESGGTRLIYLDSVEQHVLNATKRVFCKFSELSVPGPYYVMVTLVGVRGLAVETREIRWRKPFPYRSNFVVLPEVCIETLPKIGCALSVERFLAETHFRPVFDLMWNAFGQSGSPGYDAHGKYPIG